MASETQTIDWTKPKLVSLKVAYKAALKDGVEIFTVDLLPEGRVELFIGYAKYLIEYLDSIHGTADEEIPLPR